MKRSKLYVKTAIVIIMAFIFLSPELFAQEKVNKTVILESPTKNDENQKAKDAAANFANMLRKSVSEEEAVLKEVNSLIIKLDRDSNFSNRLMKLIGTEKLNEAEQLIQSTGKSKVNIEIVSNNSASINMRICWTSNGVRHCWPSSVDGCPIWK